MVPVGHGTDKKSQSSCRCCSVFEWGTKKGLEFKVACLSTMFFAVKSWNVVGLICLLFAGRVFKNSSTSMAGMVRVTQKDSDSESQQLSFKTLCDTKSAGVCSRAKIALDKSGQLTLHCPSL